MIEEKGVKIQQNRELASQGSTARSMHTVRMTDDEWRAIKIAAAGLDTTASELVRSVMAAWVEGRIEVKKA